MYRFLAFLMFLCGVCISNQAQAHPHAWIDYRVEAQFIKSNQLIALKQHWVFDDYYTEFAMNDFDENGNKKLDKAELLRLANDNITSLKEFDYFTSVQQNGKEVSFSKVTDIDSNLEGTRISLDFTVWLKAPLNVSANKVSYRIYDPTYYTGMLHEEKGSPIKTTGGAEACAYKLITPEPDIMAIKFATSLGPDTKAPDQLGSFFAQKVELTCP